MDDIVTAGWSTDRVAEGLLTVRKLLLDIVQHPEQEKYRSLRMANPTMQRKCFPQCFELLRRAGFEDADGGEMMHSIKPGSDLHRVLAHVDLMLSQLPAGFLRSPSSPSSMHQQLEEPQQQQPLQKQQQQVADESLQSSKFDVMEIASKVVNANVPEARYREGLQAVWLILLKVAESPEQWGSRWFDITAKESLMAFPECISLLHCAGFVDSGGGLVYRGVTGGQLDVVLDVVVALLQSSKQEPLEVDLALQASGEEQPEEVRRHQRQSKFAERRSQTSGRHARQHREAARHVGHSADASSSSPTGPLGPKAGGPSTSVGIKMQVPLHAVRFSQNSVAKKFKDGCSVDDIVRQLREGILRVEDLKTIRIVKHLNVLWTLDNRRLSCMKRAFPERTWPDKLILARIEPLTNRRIQEEFLRKITVGTTIEQRGAS